MDQSSPACPWPNWVIIASLMAVAILVAAPAMLGGFVWDDVILISQNPALDTLTTTWRSAWGDFFQQGDNQRSVSGFFRPVPTLLNGLTVYLFGKSAIAFHLGNLVLHLFTCTLGFLFLLRLKWSKVAAMVAVLLYSVHPMQAEVISYISCRPELCAGAGTILSLYAYDRYRKDGWTLGLPLALGAYLFALLSKEVAVGSILIVALLERSRYSDRRWRIVAVMTLPLMVYGCARILLLSSEAHSRFDLGDQPLVALSLLGFYISRVLWPIEPRALYEHLAPQDSGLMTAVGLLTLVALLWSLNRSDRQQHPPLLGIFWFLIFIGPVLHIIPFGTVAAERYLYLPLMGGCASIGWLVSRGLARDGWVRRSTIIFSVSALLVLGLATSMRTGSWRSEITLWGEELSRSPIHHSVYANLGTVLIEEGRVKEAHVAYLKAWSLAPGHGHTFRNLMRIESAQLPVHLRREFLSTVLKANVTYDALMNWSVRARALGLTPLSAKVEQRALVLKNRSKK